MLVDAVSAKDLRRDCEVLERSPIRFTRASSTEMTGNKDRPERN